MGMAIFDEIPLNLIRNYLQFIHWHILAPEGSYAKTGNEKILVGVKITDDFLETEAGEKVQFSFDTVEKRSTDEIYNDGEYENYENYDFDNQDQNYMLCQQQCLVR